MITFTFLLIFRILIIVLFVCFLDETLCGGVSLFTLNLAYYVVWFFYDDVLCRWFLCVLLSEIYSLISRQLFNLPSLLEPEFWISLREVHRSQQYAIAKWSYSNLLTQLRKYISFCYFISVFYQKVWTLFVLMFYFWITLLQFLQFVTIYQDINYFIFCWVLSILFQAIELLNFLIPQGVQFFLLTFFFFLFFSSCWPVLDLSYHHPPTLLLLPLSVTIKLVNFLQACKLLSLIPKPSNLTYLFFSFHFLL